MRGGIYSIVFIFDITVVAAFHFIKARTATRGLSGAGGSEISLLRPLVESREPRRACAFPANMCPVIFVGMQTRPVHNHSEHVFWSLRCIASRFTSPRPADIGERGERKRPREKEQESSWRSLPMALVAPGFV